MPDRWNTLQWQGQPGHYEVYYLTFTDPASGVGFWIRYTMVAPLPETGEEATCSLWFMAMDRADPSQNVGEKVSFPVSALSAEAVPFKLQINDSVLTDKGMSGSLERDGQRYAWDLSWNPRLPAYGHVHPVLRAAKLAKTILFLPHPDVEVNGWIEMNGRRIEVQGARGGQAHLWGAKHATRWAWMHCSDFNGSGGGDSFVDGVSVFVPRFGRELGPNTPVVARVRGQDVLSISPLAVQRNPSEFSLESWRFEARTSRRKLEGVVSARRQDLVGVTYHDPDGQLAYCYNTEVADMTLELFERSAPFTDWRKQDELTSNGRAHFEYAQREPVEGVALKVK
jgi:tocopherol cyclase-like protein